MVTDCAEVVIVRGGCFFASHVRWRNVSRAESWYGCSGVPVLGKRKMRVGDRGAGLDAVNVPRCCRAGRRVGRRLGGGVFGVHVLRRGGRTFQNRLSDNIIPLFFGRPARAGRTLTVKGLIISGRGV